MRIIGANVKKIKADASNVKSIPASVDNIKK
jgi:hypothetical protein